MIWIESYHVWWFESPDELAGLLVVSVGWERDVIHWHFQLQFLPWHGGDLLWFWHDVLKEQNKDQLRRCKNAISFIPFGSLTFARVPSTQYPAMITPFLLSVHQLSKSSLDRPLCIIPGDAMTTLGPMSSKWSMLWTKPTHYLRITRVMNLCDCGAAQLTLRLLICLKTKGLLMLMALRILSFIALT